MNKISSCDLSEKNTSQRAMLAARVYEADKRTPGLLQLTEQYLVSRRSLERAIYVVRRVPEETTQKILSGELTLFVVEKMLKTKK